MTEQQFKATIISLLDMSPEYRDDSTLLVVAVWAHELGGKFQLQRMSALDLLNMVTSGKLKSPSEIINCSNRLQDTHKNLRGEHYEIRQQNSKGTVEHEKVGTDDVE